MHGKLGWDKNSLFGDPLFSNPEQGDYTVLKGSPALELGFKNFDMNQLGVKKVLLRAIARTPELPVVGQQKKVKVKANTTRPTF